MRYFITRDYTLRVVTSDTLADTVAFAVDAMQAHNYSNADIEDEDGQALGTVWYAAYSGKIMYSYVGCFPDVHEYNA